MKTKSIFLLALILVFSCSSSKSSPGNSNGPVSEFTSISAQSGIDIRFTEGKAATVELEKEADGNIYIQAEVINGRLELSLKEEYRNRRNNFKNLKMVARVSCKNLEKVSLSGGARFVTDELKGNKKSFSGSGGSSFSVDRMKADQLNISMSGGASVNFSRIETNKADISTSGGSSVNVDFSKAGDIKASTSGGANIRLTGKADMISASASGAASVDITGLSYGNSSTSQSGMGKIVK